MPCYSMQASARWAQFKTVTIQVSVIQVLHFLQSSHAFSENHDTHAWVQGTCQAPWKLRMKEDDTRLNTTVPRGLSSSMVSRVSKVPENTRNSQRHVCAAALDQLTAMLVSQKSGCKGYTCSCYSYRPSCMKMPTCTTSLLPLPCMRRERSMVL